MQKALPFIIHHIPHHFHTSSVFCLFSVSLNPVGTFVVVIVVFSVSLDPVGTFVVVIVVFSVSLDPVGTFVVVIVVFLFLSTL